MEHIEMVISRFTIGTDIAEEEWCYHIVFAALSFQALEEVPRENTLAARRLSMDQKKPPLLALLRPCLVLRAVLEPLQG